MFCLALSLQKIDSSIERLAQLLRRKRFPRRLAGLVCDFEQIS